MVSEPLNVPAPGFVPHPRSLQPSQARSKHRFLEEYLQLFGANRIQEDE